MKLISVCIPTSEMKGKGAGFLRHNFEILLTQTFKDFEVVVTDNSRDQAIAEVCAAYKDRLDIRYYHNRRDIGMSANANKVMKLATGKLIKIIFLDDYLYDKDALQNIAAAFDLEKDHWLMTACEHSRDGITNFWPFYPKFHDQIHLGDNSLSSPSVMTIRNKGHLNFDKHLKWLMDCDFYKRYSLKFGPPKILNTITVVNRLGDHQTTNTAANKKVRGDEYRYILKKYREKALLKTYDERQVPKLELPNVTLVAVTETKINETIKALKLSLDGIRYHEAILVSNVKPKHLPTSITWKALDNRNLAGLVTTDFTLFVGQDGFVLRPYKWKEVFTKYDYVGNGGFSLRSKKFLEGKTKDLVFAPQNITKEFVGGPDDSDISVQPFGFYKNKRFFPKWFLTRKYLKKVKSIPRLRRLVNNILS